jgi:hypothetical protein
MAERHGGTAWRNGRRGPLVSRVHDRHSVAVVTSDSDEQIPALPAIPVSAGALIFDRAGRLLILKPVYKSGWTISGGVMEADGESPWEACRREVREDLPARRPGRRAAAVARADPAPGARRHGRTEADLPGGRPQGARCQESSRSASRRGTTGQVATLTAGQDEVALRARPLGAVPVGTQVRLAALRALLARHTLAHAHRPTVTGPCRGRRQGSPDQRLRTSSN